MFIKVIRYFVVLLSIILFYSGTTGKLCANRENVYSLMKSVVDHQNNLTFEGEMTVVFLSYKEPTATIAKIYNDGPMERLEYITGKSKFHHVVISDDTNTYYLQPNSNLFVEENLLDETGLELDRIQLAFENYAWKIVKQENFIGQNTFVVEAQPKEITGMLYKFWVDSKHKLILKKEIYNKNGTLISTTQFTSIKFEKKLPDNLFTVEISGAGKKRLALVSKKLPIEEAYKKVNFTPDFPKKLPNGYLLEGCYLENNKGKQRLRLAYTDGIESVSLFETAIGNNLSNKKNKASRNNAITVGRSKTSQLKMLTWNDNQINFVLIGAIDFELLKKMAVSINGNILDDTAKTTGTRNIFNYFKQGLKQLFGCNKKNW